MQANTDPLKNLNHAEVDKVINAIINRLRPPAGVWFDFFSYSMDIDLGASTTAQATFLVQNDSAFAITDTCQFITTQTDTLIANSQPYGSGGGATLGNLVTIQLTDSGSGRSLSDARVAIDSLFGTAMRPFHWPRPKVLPPSSVFNASLFNLSAVTMTWRLTFHGYKIFGLNRR